MRTLVATLTALMLFATTPVVAGDIEEGAAAILAGDYQKAFQLFEPIAEQEDARAQFVLSGMYFQGKGVPENDVLAYAWVSIAAAQGHPSGKEMKEHLAKIISPAQIAEAQKLSRELWEKYVVPLQKE